MSLSLFQLFNLIRKHKLNITDKIVEEMEQNADCIRYFLHTTKTWEHHESMADISFYPPLFLQRPFTCTICKKAFARKRQLVKHRKVHVGKKSWKCTYCKKCFTKKSNLTKHQRTHSGEKPYHCTIC